MYASHWNACVRVLNQRMDKGGNGKKAFIVIPEYIGRGNFILENSYTDARTHVLVISDWKCRGQHTHFVF